MVGGGKSICDLLSKVSDGSSAWHGKGESAR